MDGSEAVAQLQHIRDMQINDLRKADENASANFLVCVGCLNATEVVGGVRSELLGREGRGAVTARLKSGLEALGDDYRKHEQDLIDLRNSMIHAYIGKVRNYTDVYVANKKDPIARLLKRGVQVMNGRFIVNVSTWIEDLNTAWSSVLKEIEMVREKAGRLTQILDELPVLR